MRRFGRSLSFGVALMVLVTTVAGAGNAAVDSGLAAANSGGMVDVLVVLKAQQDLSTIKETQRSDRLVAVVRALRGRAAAAQKGLRGYLQTLKVQGEVASFVPLWVLDAIEVEATPAAIEAIAARAEVAEVRPNLEISAPAGAAAAPEPNIDRVNAGGLWSLGFRGQGIVVANLDTGVDASHPDLASRWRGGSNSWYDPNGEHPTTPTDVSGHGTWTMGVMVGGDAGGSSIGMAPDAKWIAAKIFNDRGTATTAGIHLAFQWLLDPDGNPSTPDAPNVVNNSWTMSTASCNLEFQLDMRSLRAAGIVPVFAAGNYGPGTSTVASPGNNPEALPVGSVDNADALDSSSGRGPSACDQSIAPDLVAPGVGIHTTDVWGLYTNASGTSLAAPHVAGALALLLNAFPNLTADRQEAALRSGAADLGAAGPDNDTGSGRLDVLGSYNWLAAAPDFGIAATPSSATAPAGAVAGYDVSVAAVNGFAGDVTLDLQGPLTSHATWTFSPAVVVGGSGASHLDVTTAADTAPGSYPLTISGTSGGVTRTATVTLVVPAPPDFTIAATPSSVSGAVGSTASYQVGVGSVNGFTGDVALSLSGLPASVGSSNFTPPTVSVAGASQLAISIASGATPGTYPLTVRGASGTITHSASVALVVTPAPDFSLSIAPTSRTVSRGQSTTYTVSISALNGFNGAVSLSITGLPSGGSSSWSANPVTAPGSSTLTVRTARSTTRRTYSLKITGKSGPLAHSVTASLTVK
jgi:subtilisin family serine protease